MPGKPSRSSTSLVAGRPMRRMTMLVAVLSDVAIIIRIASRSVNVAPGESLSITADPGTTSSAANVTCSSSATRP